NNSVIQRGNAMALRARVVLSDCEEALEELKNCDVDWHAGMTLREMIDTSFGPMRRRRWMAVVGLLRAVGHVLHNVDRRVDPKLRRIIDAELEALIETKPKPYIFWQFIQDERNTVLKEYRFRSHRRAWSIGGSTGVGATTATGIVTVKANKDGDAELYVLTEGNFAGHHDIAVVTEAIGWWRAILDKIEAQVSEKS